MFQKRGKLGQSQQEGGFIGAILAATAPLWLPLAVKGVKKIVTAVNSLRYIDVLQDLVDSYNNTYHRSIGRAPATVSLLNVGTVSRKLYGGITSTVAKKFKLHVGDHVRLSLRKRLFKKGYKMNWTEEIFQITERLSRTPVVYTVQVSYKDRSKVYFMKKNCRG